jgi:hypothetical protein
MSEVMVMKKDIGILTRTGLVLAILLSLSSLCVPSAEAVIRDKSIVGRLQEERNSLLNRERKLLEDYDDLQKQIQDLQKRDADSRAMDQLSRDADRKYADLKEVRNELHQVDVRLL